MKKSGGRFGWSGAAFAIALPFFMLLVQLRFWPSIEPFAWFLFFPTVFLSAWAGGLVPGFIAVGISTVLVWYFFLPPEGSFSVSEKTHLAFLVVFLGVGAAFSMLLQRLRHALWQQAALIEQRKRDRLLRQFVEQSPFAIAMLDAELRFVIVSQRWLSDYQLEESNLRGKSYYDVFPEHQDHWKAIHQRCLDGAVEKSAEEPFVRADGTTAWIRWEICPWYDSQGQTGGIIIFSEDISSQIDARTALEKLNRELEEKFQAQTAELARSEQKYRAMFESAYDSILVADRAGKILMVNEQLTRKFGYRSEDLRGKPVEILLPERFRDGHVAKRDAYIGSPLPRPMSAGGDLYGLEKSGREFPIEIALNPINTPDGIQTFAVIRDITERRKFEEREFFLADFSRTLSETFDYQERLQVAVDFIVPRLADICVLSMLQGEELVYRAFAFKDPSVRQRLRSNTHVQGSDGNSAYTAYQAVRTGKPFLVENVAEELLSRSDLDPEQRIRLELVGATSFATFPLIPRGHVVGALTFVMCDPARKILAKDMKYLELIANRCAVAVENAKLSYEAQEAARAREVVLSVVAHELLNPINVISMAAHVLEADPAPGAEKVSLFTTRVTRSTAMMQRLISDLLDFGTIQSGNLKIDRASVPVSSIVATALDSMSLRAKEKQQRLEINVAEELSTLFCDQGRIVQVLWNLIGNAIKFTPDDGSISLDVFADENFVHFVVTDSGPGLEAHELTKVFDRFWQSGKSSKLSAGLGLAIAKGIVQAHGGKIWVESEKGQGCAFHFEIPAVMPS